MDENNENITEDEEKQLTPREMEVLTHLVMGKTNPQIADALGLSTHTVKAHICSILRKMSVRDRVQIAVKAIRKGIVD